MTEHATLEVEQVFNFACERVKAVGAGLSQDSKLFLYGLFKQATCGDCAAPKPSFFDFAGKAKWNAWDECRGMAKEDAMNKYIYFVHSKFPMGGDDDVDIHETETQQHGKDDTEGEFGNADVTSSDDDDDDAEDGATCGKREKTKQRKPAPPPYRKLHPDDDDAETMGPVMSSLAIAYSEAAENQDTLFGLLRREETTWEDLLAHSDASKIADIRDDDGCSLLHIACDAGRADMIANIVDAGIDVNLKDNDGCTGLHFASTCGNAEVVRALLALGADPSIKDAEGDDPASLADDATILTLLSSSLPQPS